ncbi:cryptochrome/photolyase family protein [Nocardia violaceofusca]|uniref:cryptochrome/photolyase family protein n=1 Tax=Nocardia violaceofusca TaxID=941182 RepID=UPI0007A3D473|nr:deoxyribodipyrimidine photo-lyase [Nocardia violaceofusca]
MGVAVALFTRDLRVHDNPMLTAAQRAGDAVVPLFVLDESLIAGSGAAPNRVRFLAAALDELDDELQSRGGHLVLRRGKVVDEVERIVAQTQAESVHLAAEVSYYGKRRQSALRDRLESHDCQVHTHAATVTSVDLDAIEPSTGRDHFAVFTPYFRRWESARHRRPLPPPKNLEVPRLDGEQPGLDELRTARTSPNLRVGGETTGRKMLRRWLSDGVTAYEETNDDLAADATSHLSPYLHFGCLSAAEVVSRLDMSDPGAHSFARQLAWRDFHHQVLAARPAAAWSDYRSGPVEIRKDEQAFEAWTHGRTGFPIVDAPMRQLRDEGWMPGRARLITASFLAKTLRLDWRIGAAHFRYWLVDGDVANNQMNWQWVAGTGTDTRPNRTLNPLRQAHRFDPEGEYVRRWLPELAHLSGAAVHRPWREDVDNATYPAPIVEVPGM